MNKKKVLFIDDDPNILLGMKRMLRSMRKEFDLDFAENAKEALEIMKESEFDVIVSDMRMPGMDGSELLTQVQEIYPYAIRIMLTGQADEEAILRTVGVVHQFLAKPCDPDHLKFVLLRASALHDLISSVSLKRLISGIDTLPSVPKVYSKLREAMADPEVSVPEIASIIGTDIAMCAKVLQLVNSAFFGLFQRVDSPARAVNLLGLDTIKNLVLGFGAFSEIQTTSTVFPVQRLWSHSMSVAGCAKKIAMAESEDKELIDNCFLAGLLHDIGKLVLLAKLGEKYEEVAALALDRDIRLRQAEKEIFEAAHGDIGAYLMGLWGMPASVVEAIAFQHHPENYPMKVFCPAVAVHAANIMCHDYFPDDIIGIPHEINKSYLTELGLADNIEQWREICTEFLEQGKDDD